MWLPIYDGSTGAHPQDGNGRMLSLWYCYRESGAVPDIGDEVVLFPDEDGDPTGGPFWKARRRYMDAEGTWNVELARMVLNPEQEMWRRAGGEMARRQAWYEMQSWNTEVDGDPTDGLFRAGWFSR